MVTTPRSKACAMTLAGLAMTALLSIAPAVAPCESAAPSRPPAAVAKARAVLQEAFTAAKGVRDAADRARAFASCKGRWATPSGARPAFVAG